MGFMKNVFLLQHKKEVEIEPKTGEVIYNTKLVGFLSTEELCKNTILFYQQKPGFKDYPQDFVMEKVEADVDDFNHIPGEFDQYVYYLTHEYYDGEYDNITNIGYYSTHQMAEEAEHRYRLKAEYSEYPNGFCISKYKIDQTHWCFGF